MAENEMQFLGLPGWVTEVRAGGKGVKVVPRILFEEWSAHDFMELFGDPEKMKSLGDYIGRQLTVSVRWIT